MRVKYTFEICRRKADGIYGNSNHCYSLLNWMLKSESCFLEQNMFDRSAVCKELRRRLVAAQSLILLVLKQ